MARLPEDNATPEQVKALTEAGFSETEIALFTKDEREAQLDPESDGTAPAEVVAESDDGPVLDDGKKAKGYADTEDGVMPHTAEGEDLPEIEEKALEEKKEDVKAEPKVEVEAKVEPVIDETTDKRDFVPKMKVGEVRDWAAERKAARDPLLDARKKWGEGDLSNEDYFAVQDAVQDKLDAITRDEAKAQLKSEYNADAAGALWEHIQAEFIEQNPGWSYEKSPIKYLALSECLKLNGEKWTREGISDYKALRLAKAEVEKTFGVAEAQPEVKPVEAVKPPSRKPDLRSVPATLAHLPAAADIETGSESEWDRIDGLEGLAQERAIAKLTDEQREAYERAA